jgi:hypothetical protein
MPKRRVSRCGGSPGVNCQVRRSRRCWRVAAGLTACASVEAEQDYLRALAAELRLQREGVAERLAKMNPD